MLIPAIAVLAADLPVRSVTTLLGSYADQARVAVCRRGGPRTLWYVFTVQHVRLQIRDVPGDTSLTEALGLDQVVPSPTAQVSAPRPEPGSRPILLLHGELVVGVIEPETQGAEPPTMAGRAPAPAPETEEAWEDRSEMGFRRRAGAGGETGIRVVRIFYGTDRKAEPDVTVAPYYGAGRGELAFGFADVSFPADHKKGRIERPSLWRLEFRENAARHVVVARVAPLSRDEFVKDLRLTVGAMSRKRALLFIHGYNVPFADAVMRAAQLALDLRDDDDVELPGVPLLYSWPSQGRVLGYLTDETNITWTKAHFKEFLRLALTETGAEVVHVIAHSMGTRAIIEGLSEFDVSGLPAGAARLDQVVLAAPDYDAGTLQQLAEQLSARAGRYTLYASSGDKALQASRELRSDLSRAGESGEHLFVARGIDTIDASSVDTSLLGHSYFGERTALADIFTLLKNGRGPGERGLTPRQRLNLPYWELKP
jgi:esterase/lipase superfamily enzyme